MASSFAALNLREEVSAQDAEEHTRELQIEEAFKVFQRALSYQKESDFAKARLEYKELFAIQVVSSDSPAPYSPAVRTIRYLAYRNRGLLYFDEMKAKSGNTPIEESFSLLDDCLDDLIESLQHTDGDTVVVSLLLSIFRFFDNERLSRFIVEYELTKEENEDLILHKRKRLEAHDLRSFSHEEARIFAKLKLIDTGVDNLDTTLDLPDVSFLQPLKEYVDTQQAVIQESRTENIKLDGLSLRDIGFGLSGVFGKGKAKHQKTLKDPYLSRDDIIARVKLLIYERLEKKAPPPVKVEETTKDNTESPEADLKRPAPDDAPQRASKRVRTQEDTEQFFESAKEKAEKFIQSFNSLISRKELWLAPYDTKANSREKAALDFLNCLNNWSSKHTEYFLQSSVTPAESSLTELLNSNNSYDDLPITKAQNNWWDEVGRQFIEMVNAGNYSFPEARWMFISEIFRTREGGKCILIDAYLDKDLISIIESFVCSAGLDIESFHPETDSERSILIGIYETLLNVWISTKQQSNANGGWKSILDAPVNLAYIESLIRRTKRVLAETLEPSSDLALRYYWCDFLHIQHVNPDTKIHRLALEKLSSKIESYNKELKIIFTNFERFPVLSLPSIQIQRDRIHIMSIFENLMGEGSSDADKVSLLEDILLPEQGERLESQTAVDKFVAKSPLSIKLSLWKTLLFSYRQDNENEKYSHALLNVLTILLDTISNAGFFQQSETQRHHTILLVLGYYGLFMAEFSKIIQESNWDPETVPESLFSLMSRFMGILYSYCIYEHMGASSRGPSTKPAAQSKSVSKLRDMITDTFITFVVLFMKTEATDSESTLDLLSIIHEEIGLLHFCDASSGRFLQFSQHLLERCDQEKFEVDVVQHLNCRFHISLPTDHFSPFNHETKGETLDRESASLFSDCLFRMLSKRKDPLTSQLKPDIKSAVDIFYETFGDPDETNAIVKKNLAQFDHFLAQPIDIKVFRDSFWGVLSLNLKVANTPQQAIAEKGLYYYQAASNMNIYKSRKKLSQGKMSDLEIVIKFLRSDVASGTPRLETWVLLGEAFSLQAEDDLVWTSDKLNSLEKKFGVASIQRMSLLCYCMALSIYMRDPSDIIIGGILTSSMAREIYHSLMRPMDGFCFIGVLERKVLTDKGVSKVKSTISREKYIFILKLVSKLLRIAIKRDLESWLNYFYLTKASHKLGESPTKVINLCLKACEMSSGAIEPHYLLCSLLYKYCSKDEYSIAKASAKLRRVRLFTDVSPLEDVSDPFTALILGSLRKLSLSDKKKWHHRPKYRSAKIFYQLGEYKRALEEMDSFVLLKSNNKTLVHIWKPEFEAPGKHFVYTYDYVCFYLDIVWKLADFQSLILFTKKLRRFGASMIGLLDSWEKACCTVCTLAREFVKAPKGFTDEEVPKLLFSDFMLRSEKLTDYLKKSPLDPADIPTLVMIYEIQDVRRMNNGFGPTSFIDDTLNAVYLTFYNEKIKAYDLEKLTATPAKPKNEKTTAVKTRVARRDILNAATTMVKVLDDSLSGHKIGEDTTYPMPDYMLEPERRGSIISDDTYEDGISYKLRISLPEEASDVPGDTIPDLASLVVDDVVNDVVNGVVNDVVNGVLKAADESTPEVVFQTAPEAKTVSTPLNEETDPDQDATDVEEFHTPVGKVTDSALQNDT